MWKLIFSKKETIARTLITPEFESTVMDKQDMNRRHFKVKTRVSETIIAPLRHFTLPMRRQDPSLLSMLRLRPHFYS
ncbi:hypothetical protein E2C01_016583 [Portunus trituberculatus]|uniref:Uncharacterized protein n=1 Tax=Portunus trituberculatus TaxID=210409 RepID=A0A5B7DPZ6_PORTR|nr:hypothetical protein [Portunus trituberculatus]